MAAFLDGRTLGLYVVAVAWSGAAIPLLSAVGPVLFPTLSASLNVGEQRHRLARALRFTALGAGCLTIVVFTLTPIMIPLLFGEAYKAAVPAALVLVLASGLNGINLTLADGLRGLGRTRSILVSETLGLAVTCALLVVLLRRFRSMGEPDRIPGCLRRRVGGLRTGDSTQVIREFRSLVQVTPLRS